LGRALYQHNTLNKAIGSGSRLLARTFEGLDDSCAMVNPQWNNAVTRARNVIVYGHVDGSAVNPDAVITNLVPSDVTITPPTETAFPCVITVSAAVPYQPIFSSLFSGGSGLLEFAPFDLQATAQERYIGE
jgi:hypothetical protein